MRRGHAMSNARVRPAAGRRVRSTLQLRAATATTGRSASRPGRWSAACPLLQVVGLSADRVYAARLRHRWICCVHGCCRPRPMSWGLVGVGAGACEDPAPCSWVATPQQRPCDRRRPGRCGFPAGDQPSVTTGLRDPLQAQAIPCRQGARGAPHDAGRGGLRAHARQPSRARPALVAQQREIDLELLGRSSLPARRTPLQDGFSNRHTSSDPMQSERKPQAGVCEPRARATSLHKSHSHFTMQPPTAPRAAAPFSTRGQRTRAAASDADSTVTLPTCPSTSSLAWRQASS